MEQKYCRHSSVIIDVVVDYDDDGCTRMLHCSTAVDDNEYEELYDSEDVDDTAPGNSNASMKVVQACRHCLAAPTLSW